ncbi:hypothetical protein QO259_14930 [Salinicola sp. JS01]|uniref:hypothetical protein n=1 Tax=Salinicola sp. JS01 TaxID=3050071 RepID=UPI00255B8C39|nr:hypothetical protein [Salinicola sp. JS01]WIX32090.1 hypothetical protein QO259_14930 [Salinicola sp. JS01]
MQSNLELDEEKYHSITALCENGDKLASDDRFEEAIAEYNSAWSLVPEPKSDWEASTWTLAAIADACFLAGYNTSAREALEYAMTCPGGIGNPFLHLRYGQVLYELGDKKGSSDELVRAYMGAGERVLMERAPNT